MDLKSSARAKHASSQRGKARHSAHNKKAHVTLAPLSSSSSSSSTLPSDLTNHSDSKQSSLPSNWSRYEEEEEEVGIDPRFHDSIAVKSKGANYRELLAEKSMYQSPEMTNARKRLMQSRSMDIISHGSMADSIWSSDAIFNGDDSFFTLDLKLLDQELAKVNIAERLFVDPKFIPIEERAVKISQRESVDETDLIDEAKTEQYRIAKSTDVLNINEDLGKQLSTSSNTSSMPVPHLEEHVKHGNEHSLFNKEVEDPFKSGESIASTKLNTPYPRKNLEVEAENDEVFKQSLALNSKSNNVFEPEVAEAELDALLDMLDSHCYTEASVSTRHKAIEPESIMYKGPQTMTYRAAGADVWQDATPQTVIDVDVFERADGGSVQSMKSFQAEPWSLTTDVLSIPDNSVTTKDYARVKITSIDSKSSNSSSINPSPKVDDDFDSWLDSL